MILLAAAAVALATIAGPPAIVERDLVSSLIRGVSSDDPERSSVRDFIGRHDCITVDHVRRRGSDHAPLIDIDGSAMTRNGRREWMKYSQTWVARGATIETEEENLARELLNACDDEARLRLTMEARDLTVLARTLAILNEDPSTVERTARFLLDRAIATGEGRLEASALTLLAETAHDQESGLRFASAAREAATPTGDPDVIAAAELALAARTNDLHARDAILSRAFAAVDSLDDPRPVLRAALKHAAALLDAFEISRAHELYAFVQSRASQYGWDEGEAWGLFGRARVAYRMAQHDETNALAWKAAAIGERIGDGAIVAEALTQIGILMVIYEKREIAGLRLLQRALERVPTANKQLQSFVHSELGFALMAMNRTTEAELHLDAALRFAPKTGPRRLAAFWFASCLRISQGRFDEALKFTQEEIRAGSDIPLRLWDSKSRLGEILLDCGHTEEAVDALREAVDIIELRRKLAPAPPTDSRHFTSRLRVYDRLIRALFQQKRTEEALQVAEQMKARVLGDSLRANSEPLPLTAGERAEQRELNQRIFDLNRALIAANGTDEARARRELPEARAALDAFTQQVALRYPRTAAMHAEARTFDLEENRDRAVTVEYSLQDNDSIIVFVVDGAHVTMQRLPVRRSKIERTTATLLKRVSRRSVRYATDARSLYDALVAPIADQLRGAKALNIVPDGFLWNVPFDVLIEPSGKHLAEFQAIAYAPSIGMIDWAANRHRPPPPNELLAFGDPRISSETSRRAATYRGLSLGALPDAVHEVQTLARLYGGQRSAAFTGSAAREAVLKKRISQYRIIHLATHGILNESSALYSALVLAADGEGDVEDGLLEMREMRDLDLNADLIVLSSCDTARGDVHFGEGVIGMSWAFLMAGCPTTVVSQWKAESRATSRLMIEFHKHLLAGDSKAEALRRARLTLLQTSQYAHPFYWAPFVVVGDGSRRIR